MANTYYAVPAVLSSAVANSGTVTIAYPSGTTQASFTGTRYSANGQVMLSGNDLYREADSKCTFAYGASDITVTNTSGVTWPAGATIVYGPCALSPNVGFPVPINSPPDLTAAAGTASNTTVADVGASFSQTTLNNNFATLTARVNALLRAMRINGVVK